MCILYTNNSKLCFVWEVYKSWLLNMGNKSKPSSQNMKKKYERKSLEMVAHIYTNLWCIELWFIAGITIIFSLFLFLLFSVTLSNKFWPKKDGWLDSYLNLRERRKWKKTNKKKCGRCLLLVASHRSVCCSERHQYMRTKCWCCCCCCSTKVSDF